MREDFAKVMVDCYRVGGYTPKPGRIPRELEDLPTRQGMRLPYNPRFYQRKDFGENLSPLYRWLNKQVGRPWNKVFQELNQNFDRRKVINNHIFEHVEGFVTQGTHLFFDQNRVLREHSMRSDTPYIVEGLYIHPDTKILCKVNPAILKRQNAEKKRKENAELFERRRVIDKHTQLHKVDSTWFIVEMAELAKPKRALKSYLDNTGKETTYWVDEPLPLQYDVFFGRIKSNLAAGETNRNRNNFYGSYTMYGKQRRTASRRELKQFGVI